MDTDSFIVNIKAEDFYENIADDVEKRFDTSSYKCNKLLDIGLMKDELGGKIMTEFAALRPKTYLYLIDAGNSDKNAKGTKKCVIKKHLH